MRCLSCIYVLGSFLDYLHQGDPKCFGTGQVSILAIASITFPSSSNGILEQKPAIYIYKPPTTHKTHFSPSEVAHRWIGVLGYKSKSGVGGGINWIKGFLPLLWKAAETFLLPLSHPNTRNNSLGSTSEDWRPQKHPAANKIFGIFPKIYDPYSVQL